MLATCGKVCLRLVVTQNGYGVLTQGLGRLFLVLVVRAADNQRGVESGSHLGCALHCKQGGLGTIGTDDNLVVIAHGGLS